MVFPNTFSSLSEHRECDAEAMVGSLGAGDGLKKKVDGDAALKTIKLRGDVGEGRCLSGSASCGNQLVETGKDAGHRLDRIGGWIDADDRVAASEEQAIHGGKENTAQIIGGMIRLQADAENAALAHGVSAASDIADFARRQD